MLSDLKESHPVQVTEFAIQIGIVLEPRFNCIAIMLAALNLMDVMIMDYMNAYITAPYKKDLDHSWL